MLTEEKNPIEEKTSRENPLAQRGGVLPGLGLPAPASKRHRGLDQDRSARSGENRAGPAEGYQEVLRQAGTPAINDSLRVLSGIRALLLPPTLLLWKPEGPASPGMVH